MERITATNLENDLPNAANEENFEAPPEQVLGDPEKSDTWTLTNLDGTPIEPRPEPLPETVNDPSMEQAEQHAQNEPGGPDTWQATPGHLDNPASWETPPNEEVTESKPETVEETPVENSEVSVEQEENPDLEQAPVAPDQPETVGIRVEEVDLYSRYKNEFGVEPADLNKIEGFAELSTDQKEFVLNNLQQTALRQVEAESITRFRDEKAQAGFLKRVMLGFTKGYQLNKQKKEITREIFNGEVDQTETLTALVDMVKEGPHVTKREDGGFDIDAAGAKDFEGDLSESEHEAIDHFNEVAREFSALPYEYKTGTPEQQDQYAELENEYKVSRNTLMLIKKSQGVSEAEQTAYGNRLDRNVTMNQFMDSNPEVETTLMNIKNETVLAQTIEEIINPKGALSSKGGIMAMGYAGRTTTATMLGTSSLVTLPLVGAAIGLWRGRVNAKETLTENELLARSGETWKQDKSWFEKKYEEKTGEEVANEVRHNIMSAEHLVGKMEMLIERIEEADNEETISILLKKLQARISYTEDKIRSNMVDFGKIHAQTGNQLDLLQVLGTAKAYGEMPNDEELEKRVNQYLGYLDDSVDTRQKKYVNRRMFQGAAIGAGFAFAGAAIADEASEATPITTEATGSTREAATVDFANSYVRVGGDPSEFGEPSDLGEPTIDINSQQGEMLNEQSAELMQEEIDAQDAALFADKPEVPVDQAKADADGVFDFLSKELSKHYPSDTKLELDDHTKEMLQKDIDDLHAATGSTDTPPAKGLDDHASEMLDQEMNIRALTAEIKETPEYVVQPNDNVWKIIKTKLEAHDLFKGMEQGQQTHFIDELKDKVEAMSEQELKDFGISSGNAQLLKAGEGGDVLDFSKIMDGNSIEQAVSHAENLTDAQIDQIEAHTPSQVDSVPTDASSAAEAAANNSSAAAESASSEFRADRETIPVNPGSEQEAMLQEQNSGMNPEYDQMVNEQTAVFESVKKDLDGILGHRGFFKITPGEESIHWTSPHIGLKDTAVNSLLERQTAFEDHTLLSSDLAEGSNTLNGINNQEAVKKMSKYINDLIKESGLKPNPKETISDFIFRAKEKMVG